MVTVIIEPKDTGLVVCHKTIKALRRVSKDEQADKLAAKITGQTPKEKVIRMAGRYVDVKSSDIY